MTIKEAIKQLRDGCYIGEDGDMAVYCKTELGAWRKFKKRVIEDCGEDEFELMEYSRENIGIGWLFIATDEDRKRFGDDEVDWYIDYENMSKGNVCGVEVWVYIAN